MYSCRGVVVGGGVRELCLCAFACIACVHGWSESSRRHVVVTRGIRRPGRAQMADIKSVFQSSRETWPDTLTWVPIEKLAAGSAGLRCPPALEPPAACFLQYTSGSTSAPKGVVITHGNLSHNLSIIVQVRAATSATPLPSPGGSLGGGGPCRPRWQELGADPSTVVVSWLPQYHDMGLIGSYLGLLYCGGTGYYMSPLSYIRNPVLWVTAISKYRGTHMQVGRCSRGDITREEPSPRLHAYSVPKPGVPIHPAETFMRQGGWSSRSRWPCNKRVTLSR
jgi:acyl-CoA synthetase (AMP-forming)/AMP-acid ligase II